MEGLTGVFFSILILCIFLLAGKLLRVKVRLFQVIFLPASIIGGFLALACGPYMADILPPFILDTWREIPGILINFVFATLFLGVAVPGLRMLWSQGGSQLCFGMIAGTGQYFFALVVTVLLLIPFFDVSPVFATILEIGFAGGHGTAAGMRPVFEQMGFPEGSDLAQMSATVGIIIAVVGGIFYINIAIRRGYCVNLDKSKGIPEYKKRGLIPEKERFPVARSTVASESIEPLAFHFAVTCLAILAGWLMLAGVRQIHPVVSGFPLFPLAMIGGMIVQAISMRTGVDKYYDRSTFERILGFSLDILVVAAIASIRLDLFVANLWPFLILMAVGVAWLFFCLTVLAPRMFPYNWLERGVTEYGMQSGVTAMGLLLLRLVDPNYRTDTAQAFGFKQMLYEPFLGGGLITATAPFIVMNLGVWWSMLTAAIIMIVFMFISYLNGWTTMRPVKKADGSTK
ncbi:MAG: sodium:glutamate symporter [Marinilabiliales bacterium]|nr:MAG: sodium:glutamate symporter [Marinilabiliales bacterium]